MSIDEAVARKPKDGARIAHSTAPKAGRRPIGEFSVMRAKIQVLKLLSNPTVSNRVETEWCSLTDQYKAAYLAMNTKYMARPELSFHPFVKLLGYLCIDVYSVPGDVLEIGVWKGKSLALMERLSPPSAQIIGVDPCEIEGQSEELSYFHRLIFPRAKIIKEYSERAVEQTLCESKTFKLLHVDGAHASYNVWDDFLLYERFVLPGGFIVFDDYVDPEFSPEVGPAIDRMNELGLFAAYHVVGPLPGYASSFVLKKKKNTRGFPPIGTGLRWLQQRLASKRLFSSGCERIMMKLCPSV